MQHTRAYNGGGTVSDLVAEEQKNLSKVGVSDA
jgi:hypothetical protein